MSSRFKDPFGRLGVPTQTIERSVASIASLTCTVELSRPEATDSLIRESTSVSTTGEQAAAIIFTFVVDLSTPMTRWPRCARQAAHTVPTYPSPNTLIFAISSVRCSTVNDACSQTSPRVVEMPPWTKRHQSAASQSGRRCPMRMLPFRIISFAGPLHNASPGCTDGVSYGH